jgi:chlorite dismutase
MRTEEDEAFDELAKRQGDWGGGYQAKRKMAADKLQGPEREALKLALAALNRYQSNLVLMNNRQDTEAITAIKEALAQPTQESEILTIVYQSGYHDGKQAALAGREWNFCERCGKRTADLTVIHTCTPPQEKNT